MNHQYIFFENEHDLIEYQIFVGDKPSRRAGSAYAQGKAIKMSSLDGLPKGFNLNLVNVYDIRNHKFVFNKQKAKEFVLHELRNLRNDALEDLDKEQMKADGKRERLKKIKEIKKELRDLPETLDFNSVSNLEDAKALLPPILFTYTDKLDL